MQTARGASLTSNSDTNTPQSSYVRLFFFVAISVWLIDQATKALAVSRLDGRDSVTLIPHVFSLSFTRNAGAAFSMATGMTAVLSAVAIVVCVFVIRAASRLRDRGWAIGLGLLLGGAVGNLTDRIFREPHVFRGHVVDFLYINHWPVFNFADVALTFAALVVFWRTWRGVGIDGTR
ncbi:MAG: signal peptidase II [Aeromicrobium sp.]